jgi:hypothetical protein
MSEEIQEQEIEVTDAPDTGDIEVPVDQAQETPEPLPEKKPFNPKTDKVEFDKPEQQARFNEVYRQRLKADQRNEMLTEFLEEQQLQLDELRNGFSEIKTEKVQSAQAEAEKTIMSRIRAAREAGDDDAYDTAFAELVSFRSSKEASKLFDEKVNEIRKQETAQAGNDAKFIAKAMEETDENGNYLRPWLQETNEQFPIALYQIKKIAGKYEGDPEILSKTLKELDQVMGSQMKKTEPPKEPPAQTRTPNPMQGSNLTNHKPKGTIKMTRAEADILKKLERHSGKKIDLKKYEARRTAMYDSQNRGGR